MNLNIADVGRSFQTLFLSQPSSELIHYLEELDSHSHESTLCPPILPNKISFSLIAAVQQHHSDHSMATAALCLPYASYDKRNRFQYLLDAEDFSLFKQCLLLQSLEKILSNKNILSEKQEDQLRKMLLSMAGDTRVILLILLYQLALLKNIKDSTDDVKKNLANTVQSIYAPLANRLGMGQIKWQLEDWAFRYLNPQAYQQIKIALNMRRQDRDNYVLDMKNSIQSMVSKLNITHYECSGRAKHIYSIYNKCSQKNLAYDALYDTIALRILTNTVEECYLLLGALHDQYSPIISEFDDYIANPKQNGYQSIHTVILGPNGHRIEIQMRTFDMHHQAEHGAYAHWIYKEGQKNETQNYEKKIASLRQLLEWQKTINLDDSINQTEIYDLFADRIYVFSPQGRIIDLPQGATALDFAYFIHTDLGHKTKGAQINGKLQPLNQPLQNGDEVFIQSKNETAPSRDWLNPSLHFLQTKQAKQKVSHWFKLQNQKDHLEKGQQIWEKAWRSKRISKHIIDDLYEHFNFKNTEGLLIALGTHDISISSLCQYIKNKDITHQKSNEIEYVQSITPVNVTKKSKSNHRAPIIIDGNTGLLSQLAKCCRPIPGDAISAYTSSTRGVMIHQTNCPNLSQVSINHPNKLLTASWNHTPNHPFEACLKIAFQSRDHFLHDITSFCAKHRLPIKHLATAAKKEGLGPFELHLTIEMQISDDLNKLIRDLKQIENVLMVSRLSASNSTF